MTLHKNARVLRVARERGKAIELLASQLLRIDLRGTTACGGLRESHIIS